MITILHAKDLKGFLLTLFGSYLRKTGHFVVKMAYHGSVRIAVQRSNTL